MTMGYGLDIKKYDYLELEYLSLITKSLILKSFSEWIKSKKVALKHLPST